MPQTLIRHERRQLPSQLSCNSQIWVGLHLPHAWELKLRQRHRAAAAVRRPDRKAHMNLASSKRYTEHTDVCASHIYTFILYVVVNHSANLLYWQNDSRFSATFVKRGTNPPPTSLDGRSETFCLSVGRLEEQWLYHRELLEKCSRPHH